MIVSVSVIVLLTIAAVIASGISAVVGMAGGIVLLSIMTFFLDLSVIVPIHGIVQLVSNSTRSLSLYKDIHMKIFLPSLVGWPLGTLASVYVLKSISNREIFYFLIAALIFYTVFKPKKLPALKIPFWSYSILTFIAGLLNPIIGATGPMLGPFFLRPDLDKQQVVATKAATQTVGHFLKIPAFLYLGFDYLNYWLLTLCMVVAVVIGTRLGVRILRGISEKSFRLIFKTALLIAAVRILYKAVLSLDLGVF